jgi:hypothetical protein
VGEASRPPTVPLEAGAGPANPPCPACGEPLFGWVNAPDSVPVRRCEACGLGALGEPGDADDALAALEAMRVAGDGDPSYRIANRASLQAWIGGGGWALIEAGERYLFTPESIRRLASNRDQTVERSRWRAGPSIASMWGTLLNSFTWGSNVALGALGRAQAVPAVRRWERAMDGFISVLASPIVLVAAAFLEAVGAAAGRGGVLELTLRLE